MWRFSILALLLHLSLDFANPNMPGALCFDPDQSVDAIRTEARADAPATVLAVRSPQPPAAAIAPPPPEVPRSAAASIASRVTWSLRPRALLSVPASASPEAH